VSESRVPRYQLARVLDAIEDKREVEDLIDGLLDEEY
jgi:hypothetical protein